MSASSEVVPIRVLESAAIDATLGCRERHLLACARDAFLAESTSTLAESTPSLFLVRAPGRVNLIGEHVDYSGYSVLPMALEECVLIAGRTRRRANTKTPPHTETVSVTLEVRNVDQDFSARKVNASLETIQSRPFHWSSYVVAGYLGVVEHYHIAPAARLSLELLVDGNVPRGAGLSSSSALVCASALATAVAHGLAPNKLEMAELCASCERYIGVESGGMDQAISFLAESGTAKHIEFSPLAAHDVILPRGYTFLIASSGKHHSVQESQYSMRVVECRLAAVLLAHRLGLSADGIRTLRDTHERYSSARRVSGSSTEKTARSVSLSQMAELVAEHICHSAPYTAVELSRVLPLERESVDPSSSSSASSPPPCSSSSLDAFFAKYDPARLGQRTGGYKLFERATHVYEEASRVLEFRRVCESSSVDAQKLGSLMNASHQSLRDRFECSCAELDLLTAHCRRKGALGSRMTGAGWGGWTVSLLREEDAVRFLTVELPSFYALPAAQVQGKHALTTAPGAGASAWICDCP
mmetsp:Transcript_15956/g.47930  ORF Transcript_15956/g.47930 Transcript_15956/m.47930 type:complete len:529 (+) Transcript_15956:94-1680(+)